MQRALVWLNLYGMHFLPVFELMSDSLTATRVETNQRPFASINSTNPRTNPWNFHEKILRIGGAGKWGFFEAAILNFLSRPFWIFFCFISVKNPALLYEVSFSSALWMVFPESWKRSCPNFYAHDCMYVLLRTQKTCSADYINKRPFFLCVCTMGPFPIKIDAIFWARKMDLQKNTYILLKMNTMIFLFVHKGKNKQF